MPANTQTPHFLLISQVSRAGACPGRWRFVLRPTDGSAEISASDVEPDVWGERLDLLTVVRAMESLDRPSRITLAACSRYVEQGVQFGLAEWKTNHWRWEYFGQMVPIRDADLWQRLDRAMQYHYVDCRQRRFDAPHGLLHGPHWNLARRRGGRLTALTGLGRLKSRVMLLAAWGERRIKSMMNWIGLPACRRAT
jgi:ribonuclease HI